jgi:amino acid transporter
MSLTGKAVPVRGRGRLGTFAGVFTPSLLTILGIILFRRLGYVVGSAGVLNALLIIGLASAISVLTAISLSAIATNLKVKGGGDYYVISRTLGVEFGGALGVVLFLAQSISVAFYCIGFAEAVSGILAWDGRLAGQIVAGLAAAFLFVFAWLGADWATRLQYVIMIVLGGALASFFYGGIQLWDAATLDRNWAAPQGGPEFWLLFAIFFPAVTGFTQGVSMSGDLKDPGRSLPLGTFTAVGISIVVYFGAAVVFAGALGAEGLAGDFEAMKRAARVEWLVDAGVIAATLSSAMASFLGAPRILQSIARDRIFPVLLPFAQGAGPDENPHRAILLSAGIALATIGVGNLNVIAPVVSMFFLISYGLLNYATYYEARGKSPSFRPRFRFFDARLSLLGAVACLGAMLAVDLTAGAIAVAVLFAIYQYLKNTAGPARWADSRHAYHFQLVRENLLALEEDPEHLRDWRPCILAFCDDPERRRRLLEFASWIEGGSGITTAVQIVQGEGRQALQLKEKSQKELRAFVSQNDLKIFTKVLAVPDFRVGVETLIQSFGIGGIRVNMVLLSKVDQISSAEEGQIRYGRELQEALHLGRNVVVLDARETEWKRLHELAPDQRRIDVWWWGDRTSQLMLLLAYLMTRTETWEDATIRLLAPTSEKGAEKTRERLGETLEEVRIDAEAEVVWDLTPEKIVEHSKESAMVFFPLYFRESHLLGPLSGSFDYLIERLPVMALTLASGEIDLNPEPEEGKLAEEAAARDAIADSEKTASEAERDAQEAAQDAAEKLKTHKAALATGTSDEERAEARAEEAAQQAAEARAQVESAIAAAAAAGVGLPEEVEPGKDLPNTGAVQGPKGYKE